MHTKITELLGIKYPIILSGMSWISTPKLVAAVSNAGGLGILPSGQVTDRKSVVSGKRVPQGVDLGGRRIIKKKTVAGCSGVAEVEK